MLAPPSERMREATTRAEAEIATAKAALTEERQRLDTQGRLVEEWQKELELEQGQQLGLMVERTKQLATGETDLAQKMAQHQDDLARLERLHAALQSRALDLDEREARITEWQEQLQRDAEELHAKSIQLPDWEAQLRDKARRLERRRQKLTHETTLTTEQRCQLETQQASLAKLWTHCERIQSDIQRREAALDQERLRSRRSRPSYVTRFVDCTKSRRNCKRRRATGKVSDRHWNRGSAR